jgi:hypothetical protein
MGMGQKLWLLLLFIIIIVIIYYYYLLSLSSSVLLLLLYIIIITNFSGMNINLTFLGGFIRCQGFDPCHLCCGLGLIPSKVIGSRTLWLCKLWKMDRWWFMMVIAIKHGDFPVRYVKYPEGMVYFSLFNIFMVNCWLECVTSCGLLWQDASCFLP